MTDKKWFCPHNHGKINGTSSSESKKSSEILELIQAIEDTKEELNDAEFKVQYLPKIINNLEKRLFEIIQEKGA